MRYTDEGESDVEAIDFSQSPGAGEGDPSAGKIEVLAEMICREGDEPGTKSAALLVLMATVENATHPKALANVAKHFAFARCGELNFNGMVDAQSATLEGELLTSDTVHC